jgi:hypothetical protein
MRETCPRCGALVHEPSAWSSAWQCGVHGEVSPLRPAYRPSRDGLAGMLRTAEVPVLVPWPLPIGWLVTGFAGAGDERTGTRASVVALSGPDPAGGPGDLLVIAEEPCIGLGAGLAGLDGPDPGAGFAASPPDAMAHFEGHEVPLWNVVAPERAAFVGELKGNWLWMVLWPQTAGLILAEHIHLRDLRDPLQELDLPFGAPSPRLPA